jgi:kinetochore protein Mis13/DSN1
MEHQTNDSSLAALPHPEVPTAEFYKHISAQLTEPTRMRCLLGWCGSRALPPKPDAPKQSSKEANAEFQALQAGMIEWLFLTYSRTPSWPLQARVIQEELSQDLVSKRMLSDWFSRDDEPQQQVALRKKPNPRNIANAAKAVELELELERYGIT